MTLDILFTYLTTDERNEGRGSKAPWALKRISISKNELYLVSFLSFFCLRGFKLDKTRNYSGDISETEAITSLMRVCPKLTRYQQEQSQYFS